MPWKTSCDKEQRWRFVREYLRGGIKLAELCRRKEISRKTAYKWLKRFEQRGRWGLADAERAPKHVHNRPTACWLARIKRWRRSHPSWGAPKLRWALRQRFGSRGLPSESAISRWLKRWGLSRKRRRPVHKGPWMDRPALSAARRPNDVWTVDFKGWFRTADGVRVEPLTVRDLATRYVISVSLRREQSIKDCRKVFEEIFRRHGLPAIIRSDNGAPFGSTGALGLTRLSAWWLKLGIEVEFIAPGCPQQNGAHEQLHRVYAQETLQPPAPSWRAQKLRTQRWQRQYNEQRPHEALGMRVPAEVYRKSRRRLPERTRAWRCARGWESRLVKGKGMISLEGKNRFIGEAFEGERVGLRRIRTGVWAVYFGNHQIGELWDADQTGGIRAVWYRGRRKKRARA